MKTLYLVLLSLGFGSAFAQTTFTENITGIIFSPSPTSKARIVPISIDTAYALCELCKNQFRDGDDVAFTTHVKGGAVEFLFRHQVCPVSVTAHISITNEKATYTAQQVKYLEDAAKDMERLRKLFKQADSTYNANHQPRYRH